MVHDSRIEAEKMKQLGIRKLSTKDLELLIKPTRGEPKPIMAACQVG